MCTGNLRAQHECCGPCKAGVDGRLAFITYFGQLPRPSYSSLSGYVASRDSAGFLEIRRPEVEKIGPIPKCHEDMYMMKKEDCQELAYSPDNEVTRVRHPPFFVLPEPDLTVASHPSSVLALARIIGRAWQRLS